MHVLRLCEMQRSPFPPPLNAIWLISFTNDLQIINFFFSLSPLLSSPFVQPVREKKGSMHAKRKCLKIVDYNTATSRCIQMPFARRSFRDVDGSDHLEKGNTRGSAANYAPVWSKCNRSDTDVCPAEGIKKYQCAFFFFLLSRSSNTCNHLNFS